jgi:tetraprenyl-beta-curcumene synthase
VGAVPGATGAERLARAAALARATRAYWLSVYPHVARELRAWRERAERIEEPLLRAQALAALAKRGNMEGAAAFATFAPRRMREGVVRATVAFQTAYNHLDVLSEQPGASRGECSRMHQALLDALSDTPPADYGIGADGGYLAALVAACGEALVEMPSWRVARPWAVRAAERVVAFQANEVKQSAGDLLWWEATAATGSSLGVHAAIALASRPGVSEAEARALHDAYFPWVAALHSLLDHLIDAEEDARDGQRNLIAHYASREQAAQRMALLAERALHAARELAPAHRHELIVAAMASYYLADPQAHTDRAAPVTAAVLGAFGPLAPPALAVFKARRAAERVYYACRRNGDHDASRQRLSLAAVSR